MTHTAWILAGATATGKSQVCQILAERLGLKILSADSMLVYQGMDIGTATPSAEERGGVPYFGIDLVTPDQPFSAGAWLKATRNSLKTIESSPEKPLIVTGGTGLYLKALTNGIESEASEPEIRRRWNAVFEKKGLEALRNALEKQLPEDSRAVIEDKNPRHLIRALEHIERSGALPKNWRREEKPVITALFMPREQLRQRILQRVEIMFERGLLDEVRTLKRLYPVWSKTASKAIGYKEALAVLDGSLTRSEAIQLICVRTGQLAKRQETWFRHQHDTRWCRIEIGDCVESVAEKVLSSWHEHGVIKLKI